MNVEHSLCSFFLFSSVLFSFAKSTIHLLLLFSISLLYPFWILYPSPQLRSMTIYFFTWGTQLLLFCSIGHSQQTKAENTFALRAWGAAWSYGKACGYLMVKHEMPWSTPGGNWASLLVLDENCPVNGRRSERVNIAGALDGDWCFTALI